MKHFAALLAGVALSAATLHAQSSSSGVPESHRPPPGMCRIWIDGVPPAHQPAPTDCATAIRKRPLNARVVFGSEGPGNERNVTPPSRQSNFATPNTNPSHEDQDRAAREQQQQQQQQQQQREAQERQRAEAQARQRAEDEKRAAANRAPPSQPPRTQERATPQQRPHSEKPQRPPHSSFSTRRPG